MSFARRISLRMSEQNICRVRLRMTKKLNVDFRSLLIFVLIFIPFLQKVIFVLFYSRSQINFRSRFRYR